MEFRYFEDMCVEDRHNEPAFRERALLERLSEGDADAFDAIYSTYAPAVYRNANMLLKHSSAAEDVVQETFLALWRSRLSMRGRESVGGWLFITSHNRCINLLKRRLTEQKAIREIARGNGSTEESHSMVEAGLSILDAAIGRLSGRQQEAFTLCKLQGRSYEEAAGIMEVSKHTVKEYLSLAMKSIRRFVKEKAAGTMLLLMVLTALCVIRG